MTNSARSATAGVVIGTMSVAVGVFGATGAGSDQAALVSSLIAPTGARAERLTAAARQTEPGGSHTSGATGSVSYGPTSTVPPRRLTERRASRGGPRRPLPPGAARPSSTRPSPAPSSAGPRPTASAHRTLSTRSIGRRMARHRGWGGEEWICLDALWARESHWRVHARNPRSGAYGIPQSLPASKMARFGDDWRDDPRTQIAWGLAYIADRYGTPCEAWEHSQEHGYY